MTTTARDHQARALHSWDERIRVLEENDRLRAQLDETITVYRQWVGDKTADIKTMVETLRKADADLKEARAGRFGGTEAVEDLLAELREDLVNSLDDAMGKCPHEGVSSEWDLCNACAADEAVKVVRHLLGSKRVEVADSAERWCGSLYVGNLGEFACDKYAGHDGDHWHSLAEYAWADPKPQPEAEPAAA